MRLPRMTTPRRHCGLLLLIAVAMPPLALGQDGAARDRFQDPAEQEAKEDEKGVKEFIEAYHLEHGEYLKLVPPPRPATIHAWWKKAYPTSRQDIDSARSLVFAWRDPNSLRITRTLVTPNKGHRLRDLPEAIKMKIHPVVIEGDSDILDMAVGGDWVVREDASDELKARFLDRIIQRALRKRIDVRLRQVERDVIVARGRYRPSLLPVLAEDRIRIYVRQPNKEAGGGGTGSFPNFLEALRHWISRPILDETEAPPKGMIGWVFDELSPLAGKGRRDDQEESLVLQHLQEQTGLRFSRERRAIRVLFIERPK